MNIIDKGIELAIEAGDCMIELVRDIIIKDTIIEFNQMAKKLKRKEVVE